MSVVIPTLGRWDLLEKAVRAAREQAGAQVQVVIALDGIAATQQHCTIDYLHGDDVVVLPSAHKRGVAASRNAGLAVAEGEWIALLDDDDLWAPDKLARQLQAVSDKADWAYASALLVDDALRPLELHVAPPVDALPHDMLDHNPIPACASNLIARADLAREVGFDPQLSHFADWDFAVRLIDAAPGARCGDVLVGYMIHPAAMHLAQLTGVEREFAYLRSRHRDEGRELGGVTVTRWIAAGHRTAGQRGKAAAAYLRGAVRYRSAADVTRAGAALLGERAIRLGGRRRPHATATAPDWLARYA